MIMSNSELSQRLVNKSIEAFLMALEIYNKPTIRYRIEGFSFFICNAWELMLKAKLLNDSKSIYYQDSDRTLELTKIVRLVYSDKRQPLRINLEKIIELRNISTHFITEDYEEIYAPLFQSCVINFCTQIQRFHNINMSDHVAQNFLTLPLNVNILTDLDIKAKYSKEMANRLIKSRSEVSTLIEQSSSSELSIPVRHEFYQTKFRDDASFTYAIDNNATENVKIIKEMIDPRNKYKLKAGRVIDAVNNRLIAGNIAFNYTDSSGNIGRFNMYTFRILTDFYNFKNNSGYSYKFDNTYYYSQPVVDLIIEEINKKPDLINIIKRQNQSSQTKR